METTSEKVVTRPLAPAGSPPPKGLERLFARMLRGLRGGSLLLSFPSGAVVRVGEAGVLSAELSIRDARFFRRVFSGGSVGFGEAYVAGYWTSPDLTAVLALLAQNQKGMGRLRQGMTF